MDNTNNKIFKGLKNIKTNLKSFYKNLVFIINLIIGNLKRNIVFRVLIVCFIILLLSSISIYYIERGYVRNYDNGSKLESNINSIEDSIWWAVVTSTTVGYGDHYPISKMGRLIGILTMFFGIALVGVITGNIASTLVEKQLKEDRGLKKVKVKNHYIICGWKKDMPQVLLNIAQRKKNFDSDKLVLICMASPEQIANLKSHLKLSNLHYIYGDHIDDQTLKRANLQYAKKVIVLADELGESLQDVDSRTVMSVMTIKSINKSLYVCAEIIDNKYERYLKLTGCDEIIFSDRLNINILAESFDKNGLSNILNQLVDNNSNVSLTTIDIPSTYINKEYKDLKKHIEKKGKLLIGLLENTGNFYDRKRYALREAQKTPNISKLVDNLRMVKVLTPNLPVINPDDNYKIKNFSKAIVIEGRSIS